MNYLVSKDTKNLYNALLSLKDEEECKRFLRDILTKTEIQEFANRLKVASMLTSKVSYKKIEKETGMSSTTIARISKWLAKGMGGYQMVLQRINKMSINYKLSTNKQDKPVHHTPTSRGGVIFGA